MLYFNITYKLGKNVITTIVQAFSLEGALREFKKINSYSTIFSIILLKGN